VDFRTVLGILTRPDEVQTGDSVSLCNRTSYDYLVVLAQNETGHLLSEVRGL
jgi:hypothetical protein